MAVRRVRVATVASEWVAAGPDSRKAAGKKETGKQDLCLLGWVWWRQAVPMMLILDQSKFHVLAVDLLLMLLLLQTRLRDLVYPMVPTARQHRLSFLFRCSCRQTAMHY